MFTSYEQSKTKTGVNVSTFSRQSVSIITQIPKIQLNAIHSCNKYTPELKKCELLNTAHVSYMLIRNHHWKICHLAMYFQILFDGLVDKLLSCCPLLNKMLYDSLQNLASRICFFLQKRYFWSRPHYQKTKIK